jgi:hypothetical protein
MHARPDREAEQEREAPPQREPLAGDPVAEPDGVTAARVLAMQRGAGNAAVSAALGGRRLNRVGAPVVAPPAPASPPAGHRTQAQLDAMTLADFNTYAEGQADWASEPGRPAATPPLARTTAGGCPCSPGAGR